MGYEDSCQIQYCDEEVAVDDYGMTLCARHASLPEFRYALNRAAEKERVLFGDGE